MADLASLLRDSAPSSLRGSMNSLAEQDKAVNLAGGKRQHLEAEDFFVGDEGDALRGFHDSMSIEGSPVASSDGGVEGMLDARHEMAAARHEIPDEEHQIPVLSASTCSLEQDEEEEVVGRVRFGGVVAGRDELAREEAEDPQETVLFDEYQRQAQRQQLEMQKAQEAIKAKEEEQKLQTHFDTMLKQCEFSFQNKFEALLTETVSNFKQCAIRDYGNAERALQHAFQTKLEETRACFSQQIAEKGMQIDTLLQSQSSLISEVEKQKKFISKLLALQNKRHKTKDRVSFLGRVFLRWRMFKKMSSDGRIKSGLSIKFREKRLLVLAWRRWQLSHLHARVEQEQVKKEQAFRTQKEQIIAEANLCKENLEQHNETLSKELALETDAKKNLQADLKRVFMRGVCQLNFEAMNLLNTKLIAGDGEGAAAGAAAFIPPEMSQQDMLSHLLGTSSSSAAVGGNLTAESMTYQQAPQHPPQQQQPQLMQAPSSSSSSSGSSGVFVAAGSSSGAAAAAGAVPTTSSRIFSSSSTSRGTAAGVGVQLGAVAGAGPGPTPSVGAAGKMKDHFSVTAAVVGLGGAVSSPSTHPHQAHGMVVDGELHQQRQTVPQPAPFSPLPTVGPGKASTKQGKWKQAVKIDR